MLTPQLPCMGENIGHKHLNIFINNKIPLCDVSTVEYIYIALKALKCCTLKVTNIDLSIFLNFDFFQVSQIHQTTTFKNYIQI